jgi:hypothetical protein
MISEMGVTDNPDRVGFYSGLVVRPAHIARLVTELMNQESAFSLVQFFTVYHWAKLSE